MRHILLYTWFASSLWLMNAENTDGIPKCIQNSRVPLAALIRYSTLPSVRPSVRHSNSFQALRHYVTCLPPSPQLLLLMTNTGVPNLATSLKRNETAVHWSSRYAIAFFVIYRRIEVAIIKCRSCRLFPAVSWWEPVHSGRRCLPIWTSSSSYAPSSVQHINLMISWILT